MAESPVGVLPDYAYQWTLKLISGHSTLVKRTPSGREQRKGYYPTTGYKTFSGDMTPLNQHDRAIMRDFMNSHRGKLISFYWFKTEHENYYNYSFGNISGVSQVIIPFKKVQTTLDEVPSVFTMSVGGISKAFTVTENIGSNGESRINFTGGAQTGAMVGTFAARQMKIGRFDIDEAAESFMQNAASIRSSFNILIQEL